MAWSLPTGPRLADAVAGRFRFFPPSVDPAQLDGNPGYGHLGAPDVLLDAAS